MDFCFQIRSKEGKETPSGNLQHGFQLQFPPPSIKRLHTANQPAGFGFLWLIQVLIHDEGTRGRVQEAKDRF
jgi:hypothetical protein